MKSILVLLIVAIVGSGCTKTVLVKNSFPDVPTQLMSPPREMKPIDPTHKSLTISVTDKTPSGVTLSQISRIISDNYTTCNINKETLLLLQQWVESQKKLNP